MVVKRFFGVFKWFSSGKLLNVLILVSLVLTSCGMPSRPTSNEETYRGLGKVIKGRSTYDPPVFTHPGTITGEHPAQDSVERVINHLPIQFVENIGQFDERALYQAHVGQQAVFITKDALWLTVLEERAGAVDPAAAGSPEELMLAPHPPFAGQEQTIKGVNLRVSFVGSNQDGSITGLLPLETSVSYLRADDRSRSGVPVWGGLRYENIYPGFDLEMTGINGDFAWQFLRKESNNPALEEIRMRIEGAQSLVLEAQGILITTEVAHVLLPFPSSNDPSMAPAQIDGNEIVFPFSKEGAFEGGPVGMNVAVDGSGGYLAKLLPHGPSAIPYANTGSGGQTGYVTILSGDMVQGVPGNAIYDIAVNSTGNAYIVGSTIYQSFPTTPGSFDTTYNGFEDIVVSKLSADGAALEYSTFIGGSSREWGYGIALDVAGNAHITGSTSSSNFPVTTDSAYAGYDDTFIAKLNADGTDLVYSTIIGLAGREWGSDIVLDADGIIYITGGQCPISSSSDPCDVFIARADPAENELAFYYTFGGAGFGRGIAMDLSGNLYITGTTSGGIPPAPNAYDGDFNGVQDAFVLKFDPVNEEVLYSTYLGGSGQDIATGIALDPFGNMYLVGYTTSDDFPTTSGSYDTSHNGSSDVFVTKLAADGSHLVYSTFIGGTGADRGADIAVNSSGNAFITGYTYGNYPTTLGAYDPDKSNWVDGFVTKLSSAGNYLEYSTFTGVESPPLEYIIVDANSIAIDAQDNAYVGGHAWDPLCIDCFLYPEIHRGDSFVIKFNSSGNSVHEASVLNSCNVTEECPQAAAANSQGIRFGPINTRTGGLFYQTEDIRIPTAARDLTFSRTYSSLATDLYSASLGYGWTHNLDTRLLLPADPDGEEGAILFKAHTANQYRFVDNGDGTYDPDAGVVGSLVFADGQYVLVYPDQTVYIFDSDGRLQSWSDALGHDWQYSYNANGLLEQVSADNGTRYLELDYENGRIVSVTDHAGRSLSFSYSLDGDLVTMTDVLGNDWTYEYDSAHRLTKALDPLGNIIEETEYDSEGRAIRQWDGEGNLLGEIIYNADGTTTITDPFENTEIHSYDSRLTLAASQDGAGGTVFKTYDYNFRPSTITDAGNDTTSLIWSVDGANLTRIVDAEGGQTSIAYDALNNPLSVVDPLNNLTTYEYEGSLLTGTTNALNQQTTYTYTSEGFLESVTDPLGNTTSYTYNSHGQRTSMTLRQAQGGADVTWTYEYDSLGRLVDATDPLGRVSHSEYDAAGRLTRSVRNYDAGRSQNEDQLWNIVTEYEYDARGNQTSVMDTFGHTTHYEYDAVGRLVKVTDPAGNETTNTYNEGGQLVATTDALGRTSAYEYDAAGRLVSMADALGNTTSTTYNLDGTVAGTSDALGRTTTYTYDDLKRVKTVTLPNGATTTNTYDAAGNLDATMDSLGNSTQYEYDALGRLIKTTDALGNFTENYYDDAGRLVQTIDARGNATTYEYDNVGRQVSVTDAGGNRTAHEYDDLGRRTALIDAAGNRSEYTYDALDRVVAVTDPLGNTVYTEYDALGRVLSRTDANGNDVTFEYDSLGRTTLQIDALGNGTAFEYDALGNRLSVTDARGSVTSISYDGLNRPLVTIDPLGYSSSTTYDGAGQVTASTNASGETTHFAYNNVGQQTMVTDPLENTSGYEYDALGRMIRMVDANNVVTAFEYDALGRLAAVIENYKPGFEPDEEINIRTEYTYDGNGNRLRITDGNGNITTFAYDELNRLISESDPLGNTWTYAYDTLGNLVSTTDANGATTLYAYDDASRLAGIEYADTNDVTFAYDAGGRRTSMTDSAGTTSWEYDALNRATAITDPFTATVTYLYDEVGNRARMLYANRDVIYTYDAANRLIQVNDWTKNTLYEYDPLGRISAILRPNGVNSTYSYDAAGRLAQLTHGTAEDELASYQYAYDDTGNRVQAVERVKTAGAGPTVHLTVADTTGALMTGREVYVFNGDTYAGYQATTDGNGQAAITLPQGSYRFRVDIDGTQYWSGLENHCTIGECDNLLVTITAPTLIYVADSDGTPQADIPVYAYTGTTYTGYHGTTDEEGLVFLRLPQGEYTIRADYGGGQFWSADVCNVPHCWGVSIVVNQPLTVTVLDNIGMPHAGIKVYAFDGNTYTGKNATTDENGQVKLTLLDGNYRFRADFNGTQFWSGTENHCSMPGCSEASVTITLPLVVTVMDSGGAPQQGISVYVFDGSTYTGFTDTADVDGRVTFTLPQGSYRFRADLNGTQFWSDSQNHCTVPDCSGAQITVTNSTTVTVVDTDNNPKAGVNVYAFNGTTYTGYTAMTDANGRVSLTLPQGSYRFRADFNGTQFWSGTSNHCDVPGCSQAGVTVTNGVLVTVTDTDGAPKAGLKVYAFNGATYTGYNATTNASGQVTLTLPQGSYRFRADLNGTQFWSGSSNHCDIPGCPSAGVTVSIPLTLTVQTADGTPQSGIKVYAFNGTTYTGYNATTNASGQVSLTLPLGSYRFRADFNSSQYWSGAANHCDIPGCLNQTVIVGPQPTATATFTPTATPTATETPPPPPPTTTPEATETASPTPEATPTETPAGSGVLPGVVLVSNPGHGHLLSIQPKPLLAPPNDVIVTVLDTDEDPREGLQVYVFDETTYTGFNGATDENGQVVFTLPDGDYRFRADLNGTQFWSGEENHCEIPGCDAVAITVTNPVTVTVQDSASSPMDGLNVYAFDGDTYTGYHTITDAGGQAVLTLPQGAYRFRADLNGTQFWSDAENHCDLPSCEVVNMIVSLPVTVTVLDTDSTPKEGLKVYAFDGSNYIGYHKTTDENGEAIFTLPFGEYRFRADVNGTQFWSGEENHCDLNDGCTLANITVNKPVFVIVADELNSPYANLSVYTFDGPQYTGFHQTTDENGQAVFSLPDGNYHFRADLRGTRYWSDTENDCLVPGCEAATVTIPGGFDYAEVTIEYTYDPLYRLREASYSNGDYYHYTYDSVGNRVRQVNRIDDLESTFNYWYDDANRLAGVDDVNYTFDNNGNLLSDGVNTYTYDSANRLISVLGSSSSSQYLYNGLGDRLSQNGVNYTLDLNSGLTQVLSDVTTTYTYGLGRISQQTGNTPEYFLGDALGSVRQMTDPAGAITFAREYDPYGVVTYTTGASQTEFGFTGEQYGDSTQLLYLRARHYSPADGRFTSRDTWSGDVNRPLSLNRWMYVEGNPVNHIDPTGHDGIPPIAENYLEYLRDITKNCYEKGNTQCVWNSYFQLAFFAPLFGYSHSSDHLLNYLYKGGDIYYPSGTGIPGPPGGRKSSLWVFTAPHARRALRQVTKQMWVEIHKDAITGKTSGDVKTGDLRTGYPDGYSDMYFALGDFYVSVEAHYEISGCYDVTVKPTYHFHDPYDWHPEEDLQAGGNIKGLFDFKDAWAASLKPDFASEYNITGDWNGPNKIYHFPGVWFALPVNNNNFTSWEYLDTASARLDIFHFDD